MFFRSLAKAEMVSAADALAGRSEAIEISGQHTVLGSSIQPPYPAGSEQLIIGMGCFWGAERKFWTLPGVITTAVGYSAGFTPNPTYKEVCSGKTGHNEVVLIVFDPSVLSLKKLLKTFWESHNPTQGMQQGNDSGTQYRSGIYCFNESQQRVCEETKAIFDTALKNELGDSTAAITTEIQPAAEFYFAEEYHQQYLDKNPSGYCGLGGTGVSCSL
ncbi:MAG: peptide-methionine (S)-S-oxide reductase [Cellvibrionaceae bacterium]|jgi:peptide-methionine (S)-S-oxide reductase